MDRSKPVRDFIVARNPERGSKLPFLLGIPLAMDTLWLKAREEWPRTSRVYCHPFEPAPILDQLEVFECIPVIQCERRGSAIDLILNRPNNKRAQFIFATFRGRSVIFWQTAKTVRVARPGLRIPTGHANRDALLYIDTRERYGYTFAKQGAKVERRRLAVGDYAAIVDDAMVCVVERKSFDDFATSLVDGSLGFAMAELAAAPIAAIAVEGKYSTLLQHERTRLGFLAELIARLQVRYPHVAINFLESRKVAEEWTYRFLHAAYANVEGLPFREPADGTERIVTQ